MPKQSDRKKAEREDVKASLKSDVREKKPHENYLSYVKELNDRTGNPRSGISISREENSRAAPRSLNAVASLPTLPMRTPMSEQKLKNSPSSIAHSSRNIKQRP